MTFLDRLDPEYRKKLEQDIAEWEDNRRPYFKRMVLQTEYHVAGGKLHEVESLVEYEFSLRYGHDLMDGEWVENTKDLVFQMGDGPYAIKYEEALQTFGEGRKHDGWIACGGTPPMKWNGVWRYEKTWPKLWVNSKTMREVCQKLGELEAKGITRQADNYFKEQ